jgi:hypothetical protein
MRMRASPGPQRVDGQLVKTRPLAERVEDEPTRLDDATH